MLIQDHAGKPDFGRAEPGNITMNLYELFSKPADGNPVKNTETKYHPSTEDGKKKIFDDVYYFILDNNYLHKKYFFPIARIIKNLINSKEYNEKDHCKKWMPMINAGCLEFYKKYNIKGDPKEIFDYQNRINLCNKLGKEYHTDISKNVYSLGD